MKIKKLLVIAPAILFFSTITGCKTNQNDPTPTVTTQWYLDDYYLSSLTEKDIGTIKEVKVNGINHQVRLIGIDHDVDENDRKIHTTWEFANLICDSNGYSLAYQWNDVNRNGAANTEYVNSSIRKILCGNGNYANDVYCSTKSSINKTNPEWDENYTNKTVLSMLPEDFQGVLKTVKKQARTGEEYVSEDYTDKLFLLSSREMGDFTEIKTGEMYPYYHAETDLEKNEKRIKPQVMKNFDALHNYKFINGDDVPTQYKDTISSYAGFSTTFSSKTSSGIYWSSTPYTYDESGIYARACDGPMVNCDVVSDALGIAPAFCI